MFWACSDDDSGGLVLRLLNKKEEKPSRITLSFTVETTAGDPVPDLKKSDFVVSEDGSALSELESDHRIIPQNKAFAFFSVLLLDMSGSMLKDVPKLQSAATVLVDALPRNLEVAIYTFDGRATIEKQLDFTTDTTAIKGAIENLKSYKVVDKSTNLYGAVLNGINVLSTRRGAAVASNKETAGSLMIFTDGTDQAALKTAEEAKQAVDAARNDPTRYSVLTVGLGAEINKSELESLGPDGFEWAENTEALPPAFKKIGEKLDALSKRYYQLSYCSPKRAGSHQLTLKATWQGKSGELTASFDATGFAGGCNPYGADGGVKDGPGIDGDKADGGVVPGTWITVQNGTFTMGSPASELCRGSNEEQHQVTLTHGFEIQMTEVTQGQFQSVLGYNPASFSSCGSTCPVETVSWHEAAAYCNALSTQKGLAQCYTCSGSGASVTCSEASAYSGQTAYSCPGYRLPTEAEWEHAYRAGTTTAFYSGPITSCSADANAGKIGWYSSNSGSTTHPGGQKQKNAWGLYDMAGNVWEWCHDWFQSSLGSSAVTDPWGSASGSYRVLRGGSWNLLANLMRAAARFNFLLPTDRNGDIGFRCCRATE